MRKKGDHILIGIGTGLIGAVIGFYLFAFIWGLWYDRGVDDFIQQAWKGTDVFKDRILTISVLFDVFLFALFLRLKFYEICKGILLVVLLSVPVILYFY